MVVSLIDVSAREQRAVARHDDGIAHRQIAGLDVRMTRFTCA